MLLPGEGESCTSPNTFSRSRCSGRNKDGQLYLNGEPSDEAHVARQIASELPKNADLQAIIAADKVVFHGSVVHIIDLVKHAGVRKFAINVDGSAALAPATSAAPTEPGVAPAR
ncbi:MAG: biopolymer transporter ExbD [Polyangia bacterium]|jgi:hypothetical protein